MKEKYHSMIPISKKGGTRQKMDNLHVVIPIVQMLLEIRRSIVKILFKMVYNLLTAGHDYYTVPASKDMKR